MKADFVGKDQTKDVLSSQENVECTTEGISDCFEEILEDGCPPH